MVTGIGICLKSLPKAKVLFILNGLPRAVAVLLQLT